MAHELPSREAISEKYKWWVTDLYKDDKSWSADYDSISAAISKLAKFKGSLSESNDNILKCLDDYCLLHERLERCYVYANMRFHEDCTNGVYQSISSKSDMISTRFTEETAFIIPEILELPAEVHQVLLSDSRFETYHHFLENILRQKDHCLSHSEEELLAKVADVAASSHNIFQMFNDADIKFPHIEDENRELVELTKGRYISFLKSPIRQVREDSYSALYEVYLSHRNMLAACYYSSVKADVFFAQVRKYPSSLAHALADDNVPTAVYENLITTVNNNLTTLEHYVAMRKKVLGLSDLYFYDLYTPLVDGIDYTISYKDAQALVKEAVAPLGEAYQQALQIGYDSGWIDVYENRGKRGGAYSWGATAAHPYVLMNYADTIDSLFTLAHEMGHALHSYFTWQKQPYIYSGHKIFVAEVASTVNEVLLIEHLLKTTDDKKLKRYLLNYYLEQFRATFFRQTMFAEFEKISHYLTELGEPLTPDILSQIYKDLNEKYYKGVVPDKFIEIEWARIPHFYSAFYVYQYATGFSAAVAIAESILNGEKGAVEKYMDFLAKGNSEYSIDLLKAAGVDMTTSAPIEKALQAFDRIVEEFMALEE